MKAWQIGALVVLLVLGAVVIIRKTATAGPAVKTGANPGSSNDIFTSLFAVGAGIGSKIMAPNNSSTPYYDGTYRSDAGNFVVTGNQLVDPKSGEPVTYGVG